MKCYRCHKEKESLGTAYLTGGGQVQNVCTECKATVQKRSLESFAREHVAGLCDALNGGDGKEIGTALADAMNFQHRYLQGELFNMLWNFFREYRKHDFDARNEWAVKIAGKWDEQVGK